MASNWPFQHRLQDSMPRIFGIADVYLYEYALVPELEKGLEQYFTFYNHERPHQSLSYQTPAEVHYAGASCLTLT
jgi:transposase InsO family protein